MVWKESNSRLVNGKLCNPLKTADDFQMLAFNWLKKHRARRNRLSWITVYLLLLVNQQSEFKTIILTRFIKLLQTNKSITKYLVGTQTYINIYLIIQVSSIISTKQRNICLQHFFYTKRHLFMYIFYTNIYLLTLLILFYRLYFYFIATFKLEFRQP